MKVSTTIIETHHRFHLLFKSKLKAISDNNPRRQEIDNDFSSIFVFHSIELMFLRGSELVATTTIYAVATLLWTRRRSSR